jgi:hypothetical protein
MNIREMLEESEGVMSRWESGELVVLYEADGKEDAEGIVRAEDVNGGSRPMILREITDLEFVPNPDWTTMCMRSETWEKAKGRDTLMWNTVFPEDAEKREGQEDV